RALRARAGRHPRHADRRRVRRGLRGDALGAAALIGQAPPAPKVGRSVLWMIVTRAALLPLGLLQGALLARQLQPAGLGRYSALLTDVNLLVTIASLGLPGALSVLLSEDSGRLRPLLRLALRHGALFLLLPGAALIAVAFSAPRAAAAVDRLPIEVAL